jgi:hypothetical protein
MIDILKDGFVQAVLEQVSLSPQFSHLVLASDTCPSVYGSTEISNTALAFSVERCIQCRSSKV